jgi:hypothetical protein
MTLGKDAVMPAIPTLSLDTVAWIAVGVFVAAIILVGLWHFLSKK